VIAVILPVVSAVCRPASGPRRKGSVAVKALMVLPSSNLLKVKEVVHIVLVDLPKPFVVLEKRITR
jgi:hypothetical protein